MNVSASLLDDLIQSESHRTDAGTSLAVPWLTLETALYGLLGLLALVSRLYALGGHPLTAPEARQALYAWQAVSGPGGDALAASPLLFAGQALAFALLGASDGAARLLPALAGVVLVLLPYLLRHRLGRIGALVTSALLLISPTVLFTSRNGSGDVLLLAAWLAALAGLIGWVDFRRPGYLYLAAAAGGAALAATAAVYTLIVALGGGLLLLAFLGRLAVDDDGWQSLRAAWQEVHYQQGVLRNSVALFLGTLILLPTTLFLHLEGVQAVADLLPAWIAHLAPWAGDQPWGYPLVGLILGEPLSLLFGLAGAIVAFGQRDLLGRLLATWAGVALLIALLAGGRGPGDLLLVVGPLAVLAGKTIGRLLEETAERGQWLQDGLIVSVLTTVAVFCYIELASYAFRREASFLWLAALSLGLLLGMLALYFVWAGQQAGRRGSKLALLLLLGLVTIASAVNLAYRRSDDPRELLVVEGTSPNLRDLPALLEQVSMQRLSATEIIPITVDESVGPAVRWYLRDFRYQTWLSTSPGPEVTTEAVVTPWKPYAPDLGAAYFGEDFVARTTWRPQNFTWADWANWLLFRKSPDRLQQDRVVLWLRQQED